MERKWRYEVGTQRSAEDVYKRQIIAIARMLLTALYHMLKNGENYNAELYRKSDMPPVDREITVEQAILIARKQGYKIKSATA